MKIYHVNAFTESLTGGNPAGVVILNHPLTENEMLSIAKRIGYSETAFITKSNVADYQIRFFTPVDEVDLCGHATIASFSVLLKEDHIMPGMYTQETKAGVLKVDVLSTGEVYMDQLIPEHYETINKDVVANSLGISAEEIIGEPQVFSTGLKDIIVHVKDLKTIQKIQPDFKRIEEISREHESTGYHVFTLETLEDKTAHCRNFAPLYGIDEEAATGTASGALTGYLIHHNLVEFKDGLNEYAFEQGFEMNRPSSIFTQVIMNDGEITEMIVGGEGLITKEELD